jgi:hypothetical protein
LCALRAQIKIKIRPQISPISRILTALVTLRARATHSLAQAWPRPKAASPSIESENERTFRFRSGMFSRSRFQRSVFGAGVAGAAKPGESLKIGVIGGCIL